MPARCNDCVTTSNADPPACPPSALATIAAPVVAARAISVTVDARRTTARTAIPATPTAIARRTNLPPASELSSVPSGTPTAARSSSVITTTPTNATSQASPRSHGRATTSVPRASRPAIAAPNKIASPAYNPQRAATANAVGGGVSLDDPGAIGTTSSSATPTPNVNAPDVMCPSAVEMVLHATVYTPSGRLSTGT